jgi:hypothetical protein
MMPFESDKTKVNAIDEFILFMSDPILDIINIKNDNMKKYLFMFMEITESVEHITNHCS